MDENLSPLIEPTTGGGFITVLALPTNTLSGHVRFTAVVAPDGSLEVFSDLVHHRGLDRRVREAVAALRRRHPEATVDYGQYRHLGHNPLHSPALVGYLEHLALSAPRTPAAPDGPAAGFAGDLDCGGTLVVVSDATCLDGELAALGGVATDGSLWSRLVSLGPGEGSIQAELRAAELALTRPDPRARRIQLISDCDAVARIIERGRPDAEEARLPEARRLLDAVQVLRGMGIRIEAHHRPGHQGQPATEMADAVARHGMTRAIDEPLGRSRLARLHELWRSHLAANHPDLGDLSEPGAWFGVEWLALLDREEIGELHPLSRVRALMRPRPAAGGGRPAKVLDMTPPLNVRTPAPGAIPAPPTGLGDMPAPMSA